MSVSAARHGGPSRTLIGLLGIGLLGLSLASPARAQAAREPGWHIVRTPLSGCASYAPFGVTATGRTGAWVIGTALSSTSPCPGDGIVVQHWNGTNWQLMTTQPALPEPFGLTNVIAASSTSNVWIFPLAQDSSADTPLVWNGSDWLPDNPPRRAAVRAALAFSASDVWIFGIDKNGEPANARLTASGWQRVALPDAVEVLSASAVSASDIWAVGPATKLSAPPAGQDLLVHWNGKAWHSLPVPKVKLPKGDQVTDDFNLAAAGPKDVWWAFGVQAPHHKVLPGGFLEHWNGTRWTGFALPASVAITEGLRSDGHGGVWLSASAAGPGDTDLGRMFHFNAGHWTRQDLALPPGFTTASASSFCLIPGTRSLWAAATAFDSHTSTQVGVVERFGP